MTTRILFVSDLHLGSSVGVMPWSVKLPDGNNVNCNKIQAQLFKQWEKMCDNVQPDVCVCNGDLCDGDNYHSGGEGLWTSDKDTQVNSAVKLLEMVDAKVYHGTDGSNYHTGNKWNLDRMVMEKLGGSFDIDQLIQYDGVTFHCRHATGFSKLPHLRSGPLNTDIFNTFMDNLDDDFDIDVCVRSHTHYTHQVSWREMLGVITPCWKWKDTFGRQKTSLTPDLGYVYFDCDDGEYSVNTRTFKLPQRLRNMNMITDVGE